jgi:hypothetical protein
LIVVPQVLTSLLRDVDRPHGDRLSLAFAERALRQCAGALTGAQLTASLAYLEAARRFLAAQADVSTVERARNDFYAARGKEDDQGWDIMWISEIAVASCCQREMEAAGFLMKKSYVPDVVAVAKEAQNKVAKWAATPRPPEDVRQASQRARWEEARWQLHELVETAPYPND